MIDKHDSFHSDRENVLRVAAEVVYKMQLITAGVLTDLYTYV